MISLNVNIDHVATLRQARGGVEPDPVTAALMAELAGASGIVCHLREDRRHLQDRDLRILREVVQTKLDLEMGANNEIIEIALKTKPDLVTIVPENRAELTTEGGLDVLANIEKFKILSQQMHDNGIEVSFFIEPDESQIDAALKCDADIVEFHTGIYANAKGEHKLDQLEILQQAAGIAYDSGLFIVAGHGLNYENTKDICLIDEIHELSIGHSIIARAVYVGIERAVKEMLALINNATLHRNSEL